MQTRSLLSILILCCFITAPARAHVGGHPSVHDTVAAIVERMRSEIPHEELRALDRGRAEAFLTRREREILGREHISFFVSVPVTVWVIRPDAKEELFWLKDQGFSNGGVEWTSNGRKLAGWRKDFSPGWIGLGVNSLAGGGTHYFIVVQPKQDGLEIDRVYPGQLRTVALEAGARPYVDRDDVLETVPEALAGSMLIQTQHRQRDDARLLNIFRFTEHRASRTPDQVILTWSGDPKTTQAIQWRTDLSAKKGRVRYQKKRDVNPLAGRRGRTHEVKARTSRIESKQVVNETAVHHHTALLGNLEPGTVYTYTVGDGKFWSEPAEFTTAPDGARPFSFVYMGDAQNGLDRWGTLIKNAYRSRPDAAFYIMAGDLVNRGADRDDWDSLFYNAAGVYDRRQLVPAIGNHECQGGHPSLYLNLFELPKNGPAGIEPERAYSFEYSNALIVVLDSNLAPETQTAWLEQQLAGSKATWKFVVYHHPAYSSAPKRDNTKLRELWGALFDKYHVDLALQGHDHAYLRTYPMKGNERVASPADGTIYIVSVSGTKLYQQDQRDHTEFGMTNVSTYQVLDIQISGDRLVYRAYDIDGKVRDEFVIEKGTK